MAKYFSAYRIDHVLGFFRIWEMPDHAVTGLMGRFRPSVPLSTVSSQLLCENFGLFLILWASANNFQVKSLINWSALNRRNCKKKGFGISSAWAPLMFVATFSKKNLGTDGWKLLTSILMNLNIFAINSSCSITPRRRLLQQLHLKVLLLQWNQKQGQIKLSCLIFFMYVLNLQTLVFKIVDELEYYPSNCNWDLLVSVRFLPTSLEVA